MKFTEALLLGSMNSHQSFYGNSDKGKCALDTACDATGGVLETFGWQTAMIRWPWLNTKIEIPAVLPEWWGIKSDGIRPKLIPIFEIIYGLNDNCKWPRPRIAEWVKPYEALYDVPVEQPITEATLVTR